MPRRSTAERGYGSAHQRLRRQLAVAVAAGGIRCSRCGDEIRPWEGWDLDHADDRRGYRGAAHSSCNRSAGATAGNAVRRMTDEQRAIQWAAQYEADQERLARERGAAPVPRIY